MKSDFHVNFLTLFPEMFPGTLGLSIAGKALKENKWSYDIINIRDFADDKHATVDDIPYGGGAGMVMRADVLGKAVESVLNGRKDVPVLYPSPRGEIITQRMVEETVKLKEIIIICGRYEGVDQRFLDFDLG